MSKRIDPNFKSLRDILEEKYPLIPESILDKYNPPKSPYSKPILPPTLPCPLRCGGDVTYKRQNDGFRCSRCHAFWGRLE